MSSVPASAARRYLTIRSGSLIWQDDGFAPDGAESVGDGDRHDE